MCSCRMLNQQQRLTSLREKVKTQKAEIQATRLKMAGSLKKVVYTCMYNAYTYTCLRMHVHIHVHVYMYMYKCTYTCIHVYVQMYIYMYTCICTNVHERNLL